MELIMDTQKIRHQFLLRELALTEAYIEVVANDEDTEQNRQQRRNYREHQELLEHLLFDDDGNLRRIY
jgi:hypothetical protein